MKLTTAVPLIIAAACAAASIYLGTKLADTRAQMAQLEQASVADAARIHQLEAAREPAAAPPPIEARGFTASSADPTPRIDTPAMAEAASVASPPVAPRSRRDPIDDTPEGQNMRRLQTEVRLRRTYADMPASLGLDAKQADALFDLLADSQVTVRDALRAHDGNADGRRAVEDAARVQRDADIANLLGPGQAAEFQSFEKSLPARMQVNRIGESLAAANVPLSAAQRDSLIAAVMVEREASPPPERPDDGGPGDSSYQARYLDWQADFSSRVQARLEPLLSAAQVTQYRQAVTVQNARRAAARARAERSREATTR